MELFFLFELLVALLKHLDLFAYLLSQLLLLGSMFLPFDSFQLLDQLLVALLHQFLHFLLPGLLPLPLDVYIALENTFDFQLCLLQLFELCLLGLCHAEVGKILLLLHVEDESSGEVLL